jgi:hypothetical protein
VPASHHTLPTPEIQQIGPSLTSVVSAPILQQLQHQGAVLSPLAYNSLTAPTSATTTISSQTQSSPTDACQNLVELNDKLVALSAKLQQEQCDLQEASDDTISSEQDERKEIDNIKHSSNTTPSIAPTETTSLQTISSAATIPTVTTTTATAIPTSINLNGENSQKTLQVDTLNGLASALQKVCL